MFLCLTLGGLIQGFALFDPGVDFSNSVSLVMPFRATSAFGALVLFASTIVFADSFIRNLLGAAVFPAAPAASSTTKETPRYE
jgi:hypothetical protein